MNGEYGLPPGVTFEQARERLCQYIARKVEDPGLVCLRFEQMSGGSSNQTFLFEAAYTSEGAPKTTSFIVRWDPEIGLVEPYDMGYQFRIMHALQNSDVPMAKTYWLEEDPDVVGRAFFVVEKVDGQIGSRAIHDADPVHRKAKRRSYVETLAAIHAVDWRARGMDAFMRVPGPGKDYVLHEVDRWEEVIHRKQAEMDPVVEAAAAWMRENAFDLGELCLIHGDCSGANYMYQGDKVAAVLDWEMSTLGDPQIELGWYLGCVQTLGASITGLDPAGIEQAREEFLETYQEITGRAPDPKKNLLGEVFYNYQLISVSVSGQWIRRQAGVPDETAGFNNVFRSEIQRLIGV